MSGLVGISSISPLDRDWTEELLAAMGADITYVSDDVVDTWYDEHLGVARVHHGLLNPERQPIFNEDGSLCIVMDGEVFDYERERRSLKSRGHQFRYRANDAEYCMHLYEEYGTDAFAKLNGSFALMLYDREAGTVLVVTDRVASHPIYYYDAREELLFGTQLRPLLRHRSLPRRLDLRTVFEYFAVGSVLWDHTFYEDVKALPPGAFLQLRDGESNLVRYWTPRTDRDHTEPGGHCAEALAHRVREAVKRKTGGDHRFGILLSGGLDSRAVVAAADKPLTAFTLGEFENREVEVARRVAAAAGSEHVFLRRGFNHYPDLVDEAVAVGDGMQRFDHALVLGTMDRIREHCDVVLDAFGFDARLKGLWAIERRISFLGRRFHIPSLLEITDVTHVETLKEAPGLRWLAVFSELFRAPHSQDARDVALASLVDVLKTSPGLHPQDQFAFLKASSFRAVGGYLMVQAARAHMPQRSIIFDNDLLDLSLSIPPELRARGRVLKKALHHLSPELAAIPDASTGLRADLPVWLEWLIGSSGIAFRDAGILSRRKVPHPAYTHRSWPHWSELIRHNDKLRAMIEGTLNDPACLNPDLFDVQVAKGILVRHMERGEDSARRLFMLLTFGRWHKAYGPA